MPNPSVPECGASGLTVENLERSARRRCETCAKILEAFTLESEFRYILRDDGYLEQVSSFDATEHPEFVMSSWVSRVWELYLPDNTSPLENDQGQVVNTKHLHVRIGSHPTGYTVSKGAFNLAVEWLCYCCEQHVTCSGTADKPLPHRTLLPEDQSEQISVEVRLVENSSVSGKYVYLNHRWGPRTPDVSLTKPKLDLFKDGTDKSSLYLMLIEAIHAAHRLGIKYLWVDCLHI